MDYLEQSARAVAATIDHHLPDHVHVQPYDPVGHGFDVPLVSVGLPSMQPADYDEGNSELGSFDWWVVWPVTLYVGLTDPEPDQAAARDLTVAIIEAFHKDPTCGGDVEDASVTNVQSGYNDANTNRRLIVVEFDVTTYSRRAT